MVDSYKAPMGTMAAGFNLTAFLADGSNQIELLLESSRVENPKQLDLDAFCEMVVMKATENSSGELSRINNRSVFFKCAGVSGWQ